MNNIEKNNVEKLITLLTGEDYAVQLGEPRVDLCEKVMYLPSTHFSDVAGFVDHECGHIIYSPDKANVTPIENLFEDIRIEELLGRKFPGSKKFLSGLTKEVRQRILKNNEKFFQTGNVNIVVRMFLTQCYLESLISKWKPALPLDLQNLIPFVVKNELNKLAKKDISTFRWTIEASSNPVILMWLSNNQVPEKGAEEDNQNNKNGEKGEGQGKDKNKDKEGKGEDKEKNEGKDKDKGKNTDKDKGKDKEKGKGKGKDTDKGKDKGKNKKQGNGKNKGKDKSKDKGQEKGKGQDKGQNRDEYGDKTTGNIDEVDVEEFRKKVDNFVKQYYDKNEFERGIQAISVRKDKNKGTHKIFCVARAKVNSKKVIPAVKITNIDLKDDNLLKKIVEVASKEIVFMKYKQKTLQNNAGLLSKIEYLVKSKKYQPRDTGLKLRTSRLSNIISPVPSKLFLQRTLVNSVGISFLIDMSHSVFPYISLIMNSLKQINSILKDNPMLKLEVKGFSGEYYNISNLLKNIPNSICDNVFASITTLITYKEFDDTDIPYVEYCPVEDNWRCTPLVEAIGEIAKDYPDSIQKRYLVVLTDAEDSNTEQKLEELRMVKELLKKKDIKCFGMITTPSYYSWCSEWMDKYAQIIKEKRIFDNFVLLNTHKYGMDTALLKGFEIFLQNMELIQTKDVQLVIY